MGFDWVLKGFELNLINIVTAHLEYRFYTKYDKIEVTTKKKKKRSPEIRSKYE